MTGLRGSEFMSHTGLNTQLIPAKAISRAVLRLTDSTMAGSSVAPSAIAPGLKLGEKPHQKPLLSIQTIAFLPKHPEW